jgi:hypothetical protein
MLMMRNFFFLSLVLLCFPFIAAAQPDITDIVPDMSAPVVSGCESGYYPDKIGTRFTVGHFDKKGKMTAYVDNMLEDLQQTENGTEVMLSTATFNALDQHQLDNVYDVYCLDNITQYDLLHQLHPSIITSILDYSVEVSGEGFQYPNNLALGDTIPSATMNLRVTDNNKELQKIVISISKVRVTGVKKSMTTPAGTFECTEISYQLDVNRGFAESFQAVQYIAPNVGIVRTNKFDKKKKLVSYSQMTKFRLPG